MHHESIQSKKSALRAAMLSRRMAMPASTQTIAAKAVARHYADHPVIAFEQTLAIYSPMRAEVDTAPLAALIRSFRKSIALPKISPATGMLSFHEVQEQTPLHRHALGHLEPADDCPIILPAVILCPLLAFDARGRRLGYGGGYYDRTIQALRADNALPPLVIGVAYCMQEVQEVPADENDALLDGILTEQGVSMFGGGL